MPILFNFYILLATYYMIYLDQLTYPVPSASSCLLHVFCIAKNPYQTKSKRDKNLRRFILECMWFLGGGINANGGPQCPQLTRARQAPPGAPRCLVPSLKVGLGPSSGARKIIYGKKSCKNFSAIEVTDLPKYKKQFSARSGEHEAEENREGDPISEGLPPLRWKEAMDHGGNSPPI